MRVSECGLTKRGMGDDAGVPLSHHTVMMGRTS